MTYQQEMEIAGRVVAATRKLAQATNIDGSSFQMLEALAEARSAFEDALEVMHSMHPLREQVVGYIERTERLHRKLIIQM